ncbi:MAG: hypothetical protein ACQESR_09480 [Planctomycetota bacterium]
MESCPTQAVLPLVGLAAEKASATGINGVRHKRFVITKPVFYFRWLKCYLPSCFWSTRRANWKPDAHMPH